MKRLRTIFIGSIAVITALMTTSCEKQYITEEYVTEKHYNEYYGSKVYTREYTIGKVPNMPMVANTYMRSSTIPMLLKM